MSEADVIDVQAIEEVANQLPAVRESEAIVARGEISVSEVVAQKDKIRQVMESVMTRDVHYGLIPGVNKPSLFKPGAEAINVALRLAPHYDSEKIWHENGHLTVVSKCTLKHIPTDLTIATGEGLCTTKETRYAYRQGGRKCPNCGAEAIKKSKYKPKAGDYEGASPSDPPGWYCFGKIGGCGMNFVANDEAITSQTEGRVDNPDIADTYNCVTPETRILTKDLRWVPAGELVTGDRIIGVDENYDDSAGGRYSRPYAEGIATVGPRFEDDLYEVTMEDGRTVRCNGEHRWLVNESGTGGTEWVSTSEIYENMVKRPTGRPRVWRIASICPPWDADNTKEAGYIAGLLDADGTLGVGNHSRENGYHSISVQFAQLRGLVLDHFLVETNNLGFQFALSPHSGGTGTKPVSQATLRGGFFTQIKLLGTLRPPRLLERWASLVDLSRRRLESKRQRITGVKRVGRGELVRIGTTCHTYIAEGFPCHNTVLKMADKRALIAAVLNGTAASDVFTQDVEDQPRGANAGGSGDPYNEPREPAKPARVENDSLPLPTSWAKVTQYVSAYDEATHDMFFGFAESARLLQFGTKDKKEMTKDQKTEELRVAGIAALALRNTVEASAFPPPTVDDVRKAWAVALDGQELALPEAVK